MSCSLLINDFPAFSPGWAALSFTRQITSKGASELPGTHLCIGSPHFPALLSCPSLLLSKSHSSVTCLHIKYLLEALLYREPRLREPPVCSTVVLMTVQIQWLLGEKCMEDTVRAKWTRPRLESEDFVMISVEYSKMDKSTNRRNNWNQRFKCSRGALCISHLLCFCLCLSQTASWASLVHLGRTCPVLRLVAGGVEGGGALSLLFLLPWGGAAIKEHSLPFPAAWLPSVSPANVGFMWFWLWGKGLTLCGSAASFLLSFCDQSACREHTFSAPLSSKF